MYELKTGLTVEEFVSFWVFPKSFYHIRFENEFIPSTNECTAPQIIPDHKSSPNRTANDPDKKYGMACGKHYLKAIDNNNSNITWYQSKETIRFGNCLASVIMID